MVRRKKRLVSLILRKKELNYELDFLTEKKKQYEKLQFDNLRS
jgi:hypothetical protein